MNADFADKNLNSLAAWQGDLACPVCLAAVHPHLQSLVCAGCGRAYPVVDGIPVLIAERAIEPSR